MRKKILAIALATTMAFSTAVVAVPANKNVAEAAVGDATVKDLDIGVHLQQIQVMKMLAETSSLYINLQTNQLEQTTGTITL